MKGLIIPLTHVLSRDGDSVVTRVSLARTFRGAFLACGRVDRLVFRGSFYKGLCIRPSHFFHSAVSSFLMGKNQGRKKAGFKMAGTETRGIRLRGWKFRPKFKVLNEEGWRFDRFLSPYSFDSMDLRKMSLAFNPG